MYYITDIFFWEVNHEKTCDSIYWALIPIFMSYYILDFFELAFRAWALRLWFSIIFTLSATLSFALLRLTIKQIKNKESGIKKHLHSALGIHMAGE